MPRATWIGVGLVMLAVATVPFLPPRERLPSGPDAPRYRALAVRAQAYTWQHLAFLGGGATCEAASYVSYRRGLPTPTIADHWYTALQVRADAALVRLGDDRSRCPIEKSLPWMEALWSPAHQGYAPRADLDGANPTLQDVYADDNAVIGLAFLDIARVTTDPDLRARALVGADRAARYPIVAGLWDGEFGGGLWWTNQRDALGEGKPAQSTALLAHVMAELYAETGNPVYRQHALDSLAWLDRSLWSDPHNLYAYSVVHPPGEPGGQALSEHYFGYDQAIVIQALLTLHRLEPSNPWYLQRAQQLGRATDRYFWHRELGGYTLEADVLDLYASYGVWISDAFLDLYAADGDRFWLDRARANFEAQHERFRDGHSGGYYRMLFPCADGMQVHCEPGARWGYDRDIFLLSQAMMQRVAALLARYE